MSRSNLVCSSSSLLLSRLASISLRAFLLDYKIHYFKNLEQKYQTVQIRFLPRICRLDFANELDGAVNSISLESDDSLCSSDLRSMGFSFFRIANFLPDLALKNLTFWSLIYKVICKLHNFFMYIGIGN